MGVCLGRVVVWLTRIHNRTRTRMLGLGWTRTWTWSRTRCLYAYRSRPIGFESIAAAEKETADVTDLSSSLVAVRHVGYSAFFRSGQPRGDSRPTGPNPHHPTKPHSSLFHEKIHIIHLPHSLHLSTCSPQKQHTRLPFSMFSRSVSAARSGLLSRGFASSARANRKVAVLGAAGEPDVCDV